MNTHGFSKREVLLDTARKLFYENGIRAVGVDTICASSGIAKMTLYSYFGSKDGLIAACLESVDERYRKWLERKVTEQSHDPAGQLVAIFDALENWFENPRFRGCAFVNAAIELPDVEHPAWAAIQNHKARMREWISEIALAAGSEDPDEVGAQILMLMEGAIITAAVERDPHAARRAQTVARQLIEASVKVADPAAV